jgi:hypothetical protein
LGALGIAGIWGESPGVKGAAAPRVAESRQ